MKLLCDQTLKMVISWKLLSRKDTWYSDKSHTAVTIKLPFLFLDKWKRNGGVRR